MYTTWQNANGDICSHRIKINLYGIAVIATAILNTIVMEEKKEKNDMTDNEITEVILYLFGRYV